jgi:type IV secretion system protein TrbL
MKRRTRIALLAFAGLAAAVVLSAEPGFAQAFGPQPATGTGSIPSLNAANGMLPNPGSLFTGLDAQATTIRNTISGYATMLFGGLVVLDVSWTIVQALLSGRSDLSDLLVQLTQKTIVFSLVYWIFVVNGFGIATSIISSFVQIGTGTQSAIGGGPTDPVGILLEGFKNAAPSITEAAVLGAVPDEFFATGFSNLLTGLIDLTAITATITVGAYAFLAGTLALAIVEAYVVTAAGVLVTGFFGSRWTAGIAEKYYSYAVSVGVKLLMVYICIGLIQPLDSMVQAYNAVPLLGGFVALVAAVIAYSAPQFAASLITGSSNSSFGQFAGQFAGLAGAGFKAAGGAVSAAGAAGVSGRNALLAGRGGSGGGATSGGDGNVVQAPTDPVAATPETALSNESLGGSVETTSASTGSLPSLASATTYMPLGAQAKGGSLPTGAAPPQTAATRIAAMDARALSAHVTPETIRTLDRPALESVVRNANFAQLPAGRQLQTIAALTDKQLATPLGKAVERVARSPFDAGANLMNGLGKTIPTHDHGSTGAVSIRVNV